jgi:hypothetical protein
MRTFKPNIRSLFGLLGQAAPPSESHLESMEDIREAMLALLGDDASRQFPQVTRRVRYASDVQALWYLRGDLMAVLASKHGEAQARRQIDAVTEMFRGLLPGGMHSRSSRFQ